MKKAEKMIAVILSLCMVMSLSVIPAFAANTNYTYLTSVNWTDTAKNAINSMIDAYGKYSNGYDKDCPPYAVFDFDNSTSIQDVEEQLAIYQLETLRFAITSKDEMKKILLTGVEDPSIKYENHTLGEYADDVAAAYGKLLAKGYVSPDPHNIPTTMDKDSDWMEFATKARLMYDALDDTQSTYITYPWITYWFTGMTSDQVTALALESHKKYMGLTDTWKLSFYKQTWTSPANYASKTGIQSVTFKMGVTISPELKELYKALDDDGIDVWVNSASFIDVIKAITDNPGIFGLEGVDGVVAMTNKKVDGKWINEYDYDAHSQTQGCGKSETIDKCIAPKYNGHGPIFTACDSQGDFNFVTEYPDTAVCLILNRLRTDDLGILAACAVYQEEQGVDFAKAQASGNTLYVLQGRDENAGVYWNSDETVSLGKDASSKASLSEKAEGWLNLLENGTYPSVGALIDDCVSLTGKLKTDGYVGYRNRSTTGTNWYNPYTDVKYDSWYYSSVKSMGEKDLFNGTSANTFAPGSNMTRAMLVSVLYRMAGKPAVSAASGFSDVAAGAWYADAVTWAARNGILKGDASGAFHPAQPVTREQVAVILYRYSKASSVKTDLSAFTDAGTISSYAVNAMNWAVSNGLMTGTDSATLNAKGIANRAQAATILTRFAAA